MIPYTFFKTFFIWSILILLLSMISLQVIATENESDLAAQIKSLSGQHHFVVKGLDKIQQVPAGIATGSSQQQVEQLLVNYNHIIIQDSHAQIERLIIMNKKRDVNDGSISVPIVVRNGQFLVPVVIKGIDNTWLDVELVIDTGANLVVLPESMIDSLQLEKDQMKTSQLQTVNGKVTAYVGKLPAIEVANEMVEGIDVAFVKDGLMGDSGLLGMSFLGLFRFSIDDELEQMMLIRK